MHQCPTEHLSRKNDSMNTSQTSQKSEVGQKREWDPYPKAVIDEILESSSTSNSHSEDTGILVSRQVLNIERNVRENA